MTLYYARAESAAYASLFEEGGIEEEVSSDDDDDTSDQSGNQSLSSIDDPRTLYKLIKRAKDPLRAQVYGCCLRNERESESTVESPDISTAGGTARLPAGASIGTNAENEQTSGGPGMKEA